MRAIAMIAGALVVAAAGQFAAGQDVWHDPFLNWDFVNFTGQTAHDFDIIVETPDWVPNGHYDGYVNRPGYAPRFPNFDLMTGDWDNDGDPDTRIRWSSSDVDPGQKIHVGLGMQGSGRILDAYWTDPTGAKIGPSIAITYELTRVNTPTGQVNMELSIAPGFFEDNPAAIAGWGGIRTFADLPAEMLNLEDINDALDLDGLAPFETDPAWDQPVGMVPINITDVFQFDQNFFVDSFFDVFVDITPNTNPDFESLLVADIFVNDQVIGRFWNLNPQSPEPASLGLLGLGALALLRRRRR